MPKVRILPENREISVPLRAILRDVLRENGIFLDSPCGGRGKCGKCRILADGQQVLACQTAVDRDMTVTLPDSGSLRILHAGTGSRFPSDPHRDGPMLAFDIGTTSVVCFLLEPGTGRQAACSSMMNPQVSFGADVISRIQAALKGDLDAMTCAIREGMTALVEKTCRQAGIAPDSVGTVSVVGNPCMQQLFLGISPRNLAEIPFSPVLTQPKAVPCEGYLPICKNALLLIVPDLSGYVGADTLACVLSTELFRSPKPTLMVDIGTNGEMVLGNKDRMIACSTAAGPALEGANIRMGMRGTDGAIDHVTLENGVFRCSIIGGGAPRGICGSGLIDAIACALHAGRLNRRGKILSPEFRDGEPVLMLTENVFLTQDDIRQVQLAKGAIHAGITLMARELNLEISDIDRVVLAGAFGNYLNPAGACRIGLLPESLENRIVPVGNAAGSGAKLLAGSRSLLEYSGVLRSKIQFLELADLPQFSRTFAKSMLFREELS